MEQKFCNQSDEHIYENVVSGTRYKYNKILNGNFNSFTTKRDKFPIPPPSSSPSIHRSVYDDMSCEFYENSYTSCEDDNIYENLEFFDAYDNDNFLHNDSALDEWLRNLSHDIDDYETDNYIFIKSIPSVLQAQYGCPLRNISKSEITLNFLKSLWREDRVGMMSFLLETFSNLLKLQNHPQQTAIASAVEESSQSVKKRRKSSLCRRKNYQQKLEYVILSSSLNSLMITYSKSLKFYFALAQQSETFSRLSAGNVSIFEVLVTIRRNFNFKFATKCEQKEFYKQLKLILIHKLNEIDQLSPAVELREPIKDVECIYQPIWTCQSLNDKRSAMVINENIYAQVMTSKDCVADDHDDWEIDDEFSFMTSKMITDNHSDATLAAMTAASSAYKSVWILYSDENVELNKIIYDQSLFVKSLNSPIDFDSQLESPLSEIKILINSENMNITENILAAVEVWKNELRMPYNMEDEDDILVSDSILQMNYCESIESSINNSDISIESDAMSKSVYDDAMSRSFHLEDSTMSTKSVESFRSAKFTDETEGLPSDSPRKDRFRDKVLSKFKLKSSRSVNISDQSLNESTKSDDDELERHKIFGCNLEYVEKDGYYKEIPKFVVECVKYLEIESNLRTSGIYRISGNKTIMDALKKKMNDKKPPKKESSKYYCLQEQDVHTLTGLLKMFFRELNPPLMSKEIFTSCTSEKITSNEIKEKLKEMPALNYALLKYLFKHFKSVERYAKENSMSSGNIAICCGIGLFSKNDDFNPFENDIGKCNVLCKFLIDNYREVFESP